MIIVTQVPKGELKIFYVQETRRDNVTFSLTQPPTRAKTKKRIRNQKDNWNPTLTSNSEFWANMTVFRMLVPDGGSNLHPDKFNVAPTRQDEEIAEAVAYHSISSIRIN